MTVRAALFAALLVFSGCATPPSPTAPPSPAASPSPAPLPPVKCVGLPQTKPDICGRMVAVVQGAYPEEVRLASRILVVDTCPPQVLCDRQFAYDAIALVVPADGDPGGALRLRVFGHQGQPFRIEAWTGPLPEHVATLLAQG